MAYKVIEHFDVRYLQLLDESGSADSLEVSFAADDLIKEFFEKLILARQFNQRCLSLQREGRLGTYASIYGQEASQIASAMAIGKSDWVFPSFRETGVLLTLGYPAWMLLRYWKGDERGMKTPDNMNIFPMCVPVGTQIPHATGAAWAMKIKGHKNAAVCYFGDGASSRGDFHEGLNIAGVFKVPVVFICQNNQWAISVPRSRQSASKTIAQKAFAYGFEGIQVDGNDVLAVYRAATDALEKAKTGGGPTLIECYTYRLDDHTTSDDASKYRSPEEVAEWKAKEPLIRLKLFMKKRGIFSDDYEHSVMEKAKTFVDAAIIEEETYRPSDVRDILLYTNKELTQRQTRELKELGWEK